MVLSRYHDILDNFETQVTQVHWHWTANCYLCVIYATFLEGQKILSEIALFNYCCFCSNSFTGPLVGNFVIYYISNSAISFPLQHFLHSEMEMTSRIKTETEEVKLIKCLTFVNFKFLHRRVISNTVGGKIELNSEMIITNGLPCLRNHHHNHCHHHHHHCDCARRET